MFGENKKKINEQNHISRTYEVRDEISLLDPPIVFTPVNKNKMFHFNYVVFFFKFYNIMYLCLPGKDSYTYNSIAH